MTVVAHPKGDGVAPSRKPAARAGGARGSDNGVQHGFCDQAPRDRMRGGGCACARLRGRTRRWAQAKTGSGVYPVAVPTYEVQFVAMEKGFFKDEGYDFKLIQGGSGVKTREILASRQGDFAIADILHVLQLNKNGRPTRALNTVDQRAPGVRFADPQGPVRPGHRHDAEGRRLEAARRQARDRRRLLAGRHLASVVALFHGAPGAGRQGDLGRRRQCRHHAGHAEEQADRRALERDLDHRPMPRRTAGAR